MPTAWSNKDDKQRREEGRTSSKATMSAGSPNKRLEERTRDELYNLAQQRKIRGRSVMDKKELLEALRKAS